MTKRSSILAAALVGALMVPAVAKAASPAWSGGTFCTSTFNACASVTLDITGPLVTLTVTNLGPGVITNVGIYHMGTPWAGSVSPFAVWDGSSWVTSAWQSTPPDAGDQLQMELSANTKSGANGAIGQGQTLTFYFTISPDWDNIEDTYAAFHSQQLGEGNEFSEKCYIGDASCNVVPEPISMLLLGTGLAGLGGVRALRRRRKGLDVENS